MTNGEPVGANPDQGFPPSPLPPHLQFARELQLAVTDTEKLTYVGETGARGYYDREGIHLENNIFIAYVDDEFKPDEFDIRWRMLQHIHGRAFLKAKQGARNFYASVKQPTVRDGNRPDYPQVAGGPILFNVPYIATERNVAIGRLLGMDAKSDGGVLQPRDPAIDEILKLPIPVRERVYLAQTPTIAEVFLGHANTDPQPYHELLVQTDVGSNDWIKFLGKKGFGSEHELGDRLIDPSLASIYSEAFTNGRLYVKTDISERPMIVADLSVTGAVEDAT